jgi:hypothetical protein
MHAVTNNLLIDVVQCVWLHRAWLDGCYALMGRNIGWKASAESGGLVKSVLGVDCLGA